MSRRIMGGLMRISVTRRGSLSISAAILLSLILSSQAVAATWHQPVLLSAPQAGLAGGLVTVGTSTAVAVWAQDGRILRRRSANSGQTWSAPTRLSGLNTSSAGPAVAGRGTNVDVVWQQSDFPNLHIRYARSTDGGRTFAPSVALTRTDGQAKTPRVARGPDGRVAVVWYDLARSEVRIRVSKNGGASFGDTKVLASTFSEQPQPAVAVGKGVIYAAYFVSDVRIRVRRSLDNGTTWKAPAIVANNGAPLGLDVTAQGSQAYVAYVAESAPSIWVRYRRTTDKGVLWSSPTNLSSPTGLRSIRPQLSLRSGVVRAAFDRCLDAGCDGSVVFYRQSSNGTSWTAAQQASHAAADLARSAGVGFSGRIIVLYTAYSSQVASLSKGDVYARSATP